LDPDFAEPLTIYRRIQNIDAHGRPNMTPVLITPAPFGVVEPQDTSPLERKEDFQDLEQLIEVHSVFRLRSAGLDSGVQYQPDIVVWNSTNFLVVRVMNWSKYGAGFTRALCSSTDAIDGVPV
jgi:hypothetical protein